MNQSHLGARNNKFAKSIRVTQSCPHGFALILALTLMSFVLVLLLSLSSLVQIEVAGTSQNQAKSVARENAKLGLMVALGELQRYAGQDARVTARAEILGSSVTAGNRYWTGVWDSSSPTANPVWLSPGNINPTAFTQSISNGRVTDPLQQALLVGSGSVSDTADMIAMPKVPTDSNNLGIGNYSYWISDEGVKASLGMADEMLTERNTPSNGMTYTETDRMRQMVSGRNGIEFMISTTDSDGFILNPEDSVTYNGLKQGLNFKAPLILNGTSETLVEDSFHDWTPLAYGVLSRTDGQSGLKRDLSLAPELLGTGYAARAQYKDYMVEPSGSQPIIQDVRDLRRAYNMVAPSSTTPASGEIVHSVMPIITDVGVQFGVRMTDYPEGKFLMTMVVEMWNPYSSALMPEDLVLEINGLPDITLSQHDGYEGLVVKTYTLDPYADFGNPISATLNFNQYMNTPSLDPNSYDMQLWGPGRIVSWTGPDDSVDTQASSSGVYAVFANRSANETRKDVVLDPFDETVEDSNAFFSYDIPASTLEIVLRKGSGGPIVQRITGLEFDPVVSSTQFGTGEWDDYMVGFQARLRERGNSAGTDPSIWLKERDVREVQQEMDTTTGYTDTSKMYVWANDISLPWIPTSYGKWLSLNQSADPTYQFERRIAAAGSSYIDSLSTYRDLPFFELPRQPELSLGELQHLYVAGYPPNSPGNSWGGTLNRWYDEYFFSGVREGYNEPAVDDVWPHPRLTVKDPEGKFNKPSAPEIVASDDQSSIYLMQRGSFNINSTSAKAWESILTSNWGKEYRFVDKDTDQANGTNNGYTAVISDSGSEEYWLPPFFTRFPQSLQEHIQRPISSFYDSSSEAPIQQFQRAFTPMVTRSGKNDEPGDYDPATGSIANDLAEQIVALLKARGKPFTSLQEFLSEQDANGHSLLEAAIDNVDSGSPIINAELHANDDIVEIEERLPGYLTQADIMTAIAPFISTRSDTFKIRAYGDAVDPLTLKPIATAVCEATVQRVVAPADSSLDATDPNVLFAGGGTFGRAFKIVDIRWLSDSEI